MFLDTSLQSINTIFSKPLLEIAAASRGITPRRDRASKSNPEFTYKDNYTEYNVFSWIYAGLCTLDTHRLIEDGILPDLTIDSLLNFIGSENFITAPRAIDSSALNYYPFDPGLSSVFTITQSEIAALRVTVGQLALEKLQGKDIFQLYTRIPPIEDVFMFCIEEDSKSISNQASSSSAEQLTQEKCRRIIELFNEDSTLRPGETADKLVEFNAIGYFKAHWELLIKRPEIQAIVNERSVSTIVKSGEVLDLDRDRKLTRLDHTEKTSLPITLVDDIKKVYDLSTALYSHAAGGVQGSGNKIRSTVIDVELANEFPKVQKQLMDIVFPAVRKVVTDIAYLSFTLDPIIGTSMVKSSSAETEIRTANRTLLEAKQFYVGIYPTNLLRAYNTFYKMTAFDTNIYIPAISFNDDGKAVNTNGAVVPRTIFKASSGDNNELKIGKYLMLRDFLHPDYNEWRNVPLPPKNTTNYYLRIPNLTGTYLTKSLVSGVNALEALEREVVENHNLSLCNLNFKSYKEIEKLVEATSFRSYLKHSDETALDPNWFTDDIIASPIVVKDVTNNSNESYETTLRSVLRESKINYTTPISTGGESKLADVQSRELRSSRDQLHVFFSKLHKAQFSPTGPIETDWAKVNKTISPVTLIDFIETRYVQHNLPTILWAVFRGNKAYAFKAMRWQRDYNPASADTAFFNSFWVPSPEAKVATLDKLNQLEFTRDIKQNKYLEMVATNYLIPKAIRDSNEEALAMSIYLLKIIHTGHVYPLDYLQRLSSSKSKTDKNNYLLEYYRSAYAGEKILKSLLTAKSLSEIEGIVQGLITVWKQSMGIKSVVFSDIAQRVAIAKIQLGKVVHANANIEVCKAISNDSMRIREVVMTAIQKVYGELFWSIKHIGYDCRLLGIIPSSNEIQTASPVFSVPYNLYIAHRAPLIKKLVSNFGELREIAQCTIPNSEKITYTQEEYRMKLLATFCGMSSEKIIELRSLIKNSAELSKEFTEALDELMKLISVDILTELNSYYTYSFEYTIRETAELFGLRQDIKKQQTRTMEILNALSNLYKARSLQHLQLPVEEYMHAYRQTAAYKDKIFGRDNLALNPDGSLYIFRDRMKMDARSKNSKVVVNEYVMHKDGYALKIIENQISGAMSDRLVLDPQREISSVIIRNEKGELERIPFNNKMKFISNNSALIPGILASIGNGQKLISTSLTPKSLLSYKNEKQEQEYQNTLNRKKLVGQTLKDIEAQIETTQQAVLSLTNNTISTDIIEVDQPAVDTSTSLAELQTSMTDLARKKEMLKAEDARLENVLHNSESIQAEIVKINIATIMR